jgi:CheY-like chemotaxis protein
VDALAYLRGAQAPSLILLDLTMPVMGGWAFLQQRNGDAALRSSPVLLISGERDARTQALEQSAHCLETPVPVAHLLEVIDRLSTRAPAAR